MKKLDIELIEKKNKEEDDEFKRIILQREYELLVNGKNYSDKVNVYHPTFMDIGKPTLKFSNKELFHILSEYEVEQLLGYFDRVEINIDIIDSEEITVVFSNNSLASIGLLGNSAYSYFKFKLEYYNKPWNLRDFFDCFQSKVSLSSDLSIYCISGMEPIEEQYDISRGFGVRAENVDLKESVRTLYSIMKETLIQLHSEVESELTGLLNKNTIERSIHFAPQYHQAGLGILNFFGTYLNEQYPNEHASVRIEQNGLNVRMIIETEDGRKDIVEKALHEYQLIVSGAEPFSKFSNNDKLNLELRSELRIAKARLEDKQDLIGFQSNKLEEQKLQIDKLINMIGNGLSQPNNLTIDFKPNISQTNEVVINQNISAAIGNLSELISELQSNDEPSTSLNQLENSLAEIENNNNPESVRHSPAMSKFTRLINNIIDTDSDLHKAISKVESGWEIAKDLAVKYNKIAQWCGLTPILSEILK